MGRPPSVSVVTASRNDDHGLHLRRRMQVFVDGMGEQAQRLGLAVEVIVVEWNPPPGRPPLAEALAWPPVEDVSFRVITVPPEVHARSPHAGATPFYQMTAKNVGIRRARAPFVVATNIDILFSDPLATFINGPLDDGTLYRCDRLDVEAGLDEAALPSPQQVRSAPWVRANRADGVYFAGEGRVLPAYDGLGDLGVTLAGRALRGGQRSIRARDVRPSRSGGRSPRVISESRRMIVSLLNLALVPRLHILACGDFTLMSRRGWEATRGYPEWPGFSWHLDSVLLYQARALGLELVELPPELHVVHMEHGEGSGWTPAGARTLFDRLDQSRLPYLDNPDLGRIGRRLAARVAHPAPEGAPRVRDLRQLGLRGHDVVFNDEGWGMAAEEFPEVSPA